MSTAVFRWYHIILSTRGSWLPGDPRGWRSRDHRQHSSGDYRVRPPDGEHAGLYRYQRARSEPPLVIPEELRAVIGAAIVAKITGQGHQVLAISVAGMHAHLLVKVPNDRPTVRRLMGTWKQASSHAVRVHLPGQGRKAAVPYP